MPHPALRALAALLLLTLDVPAGVLAATGGDGPATGRVAGTVTFEPTPPPPVPPQYRVRTRSPILAPDPQRAVVYLERADGRPAVAQTDPTDSATPDAATPDTTTAGAPGAGAGEPVIIAQRGYQFRPAVAVVQVGSAVVFPNRDDEFHSVFSYSTAKRFDLGRFRRDEPSPLVRFDQPGLVKIYCEIHKHMRSLLLVVPTPWFTATDADGRYTLTGIPPGEYRLRALLPDERTVEAPVSVEPGATASVDLPAP